MLKNKKGDWTSIDQWSFMTNENGLVHIENISKTKVLEISKKDNKVLLKDFEEDKKEQLWKKGEPDKKGYFSLESFVPAKVIMATSQRDLEIKGNISFIHTLFVK